MTKKEFNTKVKEKVKEFLDGDSQEMYNRIHHQYMYRQFGIEDVKFSVLLKEMAKAYVLGVDFIDVFGEVDIDDMISEL